MLQGAERVRWASEELLCRARLRCFHTSGGVAVGARSESALAAWNGTDKLGTEPGSKVNQQEAVGGGSPRKSSGIGVRWGQSTEDLSKGWQVWRWEGSRQLQG